MRREPKSNDIRDFPHVDLLYPSKYIRGVDLDPAGELFTIKRIEPRHELMKKDSTKESKPVVFFEETDKGWVMNKTNATAIAKIHGPELMAWYGNQIMLAPTEVTAFGKTSLCAWFKPGRPKTNGKRVAGTIDDAIAGFMMAETPEELKAAWGGLPPGLSDEDKKRATEEFKRRAKEIKEGAVPPPDEDGPPDEHDPVTGEVTV